MMVELITGSLGLFILIGHLFGKSVGTTLTGCEEITFWLKCKPPYSFTRASVNICEDGFGAGGGNVSSSVPLIFIQAINPSRQQS